MLNFNSNKFKELLLCPLCSCNKNTTSYIIVIGYTGVYKVDVKYSAYEENKLGL